MSHCCSPAPGLAAQHFNAERARKELAAYHRAGPGRTTRGLLEGLARTEVRAATVLDIGAGIGALSFELLKRGCARAMCVDMSPAFVATGRAEAERVGFADRVAWREADFVAIASTLPPADVVTLDRVVCCYFAFEPLLIEATGHAQHSLALSYPRDRWYVRWGFRLENAVRRLGGNAFRTYVHPVSAMVQLLERAGFRRRYRAASLTWNMDVYCREID